MRLGFTHQHVAQTLLAELQAEGLVAGEMIATDEAWQLRMLLTQAAQQTFGRMKLAVLFLLAIAVADLCNIQGKHPMRARFDQGRRHTV